MSFYQNNCDKNIAIKSDNIAKIAILSIIFISCFNGKILAATSDSETDRRRVVSSKTRKISKNSKSKKIFSVIGNYNSDYNSKEYQIESRFFYQKPYFNYQIDFLQSSYWADTGTGKKRVILQKKSELYDLQATAKHSVNKTPYYLASYYRNNYDDLSGYYYDFRYAIGAGRSFFNDLAEIDLSIGYHDVKNFDDDKFIAPSIRLNWRINKKWQIINRSYLFLNSNSSDTQSKSTIRYYLSKNFALELNHNFERNCYIDSKNILKINRSSRMMQFGASLIF